MRFYRNPVWWAALGILTVVVLYVLWPAEQNHGGLIGVDTLKAANELRLELTRWPKTGGKANG